MKRGGHIYILTNRHHTTLYVGVTSNLVQRILEHRTKKYAKSFTSKYNIYKLVYYENFTAIEEAINLEKQIKSGSRKNKIDLIEGLNPTWKDLWQEVQNTY